MSTDNFTPTEAAQIVSTWYDQRKNELAKSLSDLRKRETKKALVPPHKHNVGISTGPGMEDVPPGKANPPGKEDAVKSDKPEETTPRGEETTMIKEELCKDCGKGHEMNKCGMSKALLRDSKGRESNNGIVPGSKLPGDSKSKEVSAEGSGGQINASKSPIMKRAMAMSKAGMPPMAKPPSGKNMNTHVPTSNPKPPPAPAAPVTKSEPLIKKSLIPGGTGGTSVTQPIPTLKPAAAGMFGVGGQVPQTATGVLPKPAAPAAPASAAPAPAMGSNLPKSPVLTKRPATKAGAIGLMPATGSDNGPDADKTNTSVLSTDKTNPGKPSAMNAMAPTQAGVSPILGRRQQMPARSHLRALGVI